MRRTRSSFFRKRRGQHGIPHSKKSSLLDTVKEQKKQLQTHNKYIKFLKIRDKFFRRNDNSQ